MGESHIGGVAVWPGAHGLDCHMIIHAYNSPYVGPGPCAYEFRYWWYHYRAYVWTLPKRVMVCGSDLGASKTLVYQYV